MIKVVSLTGSLSNTCKYRISAVLGRDVSDKLLDKDCLTYTGTAEEADLTTLLIRTQKINDLDTCLKQLSVC